MNEEPTTFPLIGDDVIVITGATASGKSAVALEVAERIGAEIISVDSIAVYRGMDIGTAKPSEADRRRVPHHLLDVAEPTESYSVAMFLADTWRAIDDIRGRGRLAMLVGGTPMYLQGLLRGFDPGPPADWDFRQAVEADLAKYGIEALRSRLWQVDPLSAHRLGPNDTRRMIRALEVAHLTGRPISHRQTQFAAVPPSDSRRRYVLRWPREELHRRIENRVNTMFAQGLVAEVGGLIERHGTLSRTARIAVGYREVISRLAESHASPRTAHLAGVGQMGSSGDWSGVVQEVLFHSRQLARRQETWLRGMPDLQVCEVGEPADLAELADRITRDLEKGHGQRDPDRITSSV